MPLGVQRETQLIRFVPPRRHAELVREMRGAHDENAVGFDRSLVLDREHRVVYHRRSSQRRGRCLMFRLVCQYGLRSSIRPHQTQRRTVSSG